MIKCLIKEILEEWNNYKQKIHREELFDKFKRALYFRNVECLSKDENINEKRPKRKSAFKRPTVKLISKKKTDNILSNKSINLTTIKSVNTKSKKDSNKYLVQVSEKSKKKSINLIKRKPDVKMKVLKKQIRTYNKNKKNLQETIEMNNNKILEVMEKVNEQIYINSINEDVENKNLENNVNIDEEINKKSNKIIKDTLNQNLENIVNKDEILNDIENDKQANYKIVDTKNESQQENIYINLCKYSNKLKRCGIKSNNSKLNNEKKSLFDSNIIKYSNKRRKSINSDLMVINQMQEDIINNKDTSFVSFKDSINSNNISSKDDLKNNNNLMCNNNIEKDNIKNNSQYNNYNKKNNLENNSLNNNNKQNIQISNDFNKNTLNINNKLKYIKTGKTKIDLNEENFKLKNIFRKEKKRIEIKRNTVFLQQDDNEMDINNKIFDIKEEYKEKDVDFKDKENCNNRICIDKNDNFNINRNVCMDKENKYIDKENNCMDNKCLNFLNKYIDNKIGIKENNFIDNKYINNKNNLLITDNIDDNSIFSPIKKQIQLNKENEMNNIKKEIILESQKIVSPTRQAILNPLHIKRELNKNRQIIHKEILISPQKQEYNKQLQITPIKNITNNQISPPIKKTINNQMSSLQKQETHIYDVKSNKFIKDSLSVHHDLYKKVIDGQRKNVSQNEYKSSTIIPHIKSDDEDTLLFIEPSFVKDKYLNEKVRMQDHEELEMYFNICEEFNVLDVFGDIKDVTNNSPNKWV